MGKKYKYERRGMGGWLGRQLSLRPKPLWTVVAADALLIAVALVVFALFHHVLPRRGQSTGMVSSREASVGAQALIAEARGDSSEPDDGEPAERIDLSRMTGGEISFAEDGGSAASPEAPQAPEAEGADAPSGDAGLPEGEASEDAQADSGQTDAAEATRSGQTASGVEVTEASFSGGIPDVPGYFGNKFADKFTDGEVIKSQNGYQSKNLSIGLMRYESDNVVFYVADIYVRDISCLVSAFAKDTYGRGVTDSTVNIAKGVNAILAINGDYYGARPDGVVIRNGELYREDLYPVRDVCVLFWDGTMETYEVAKFDARAAIQAGAYQAWNFGPRLLDDEGNAKTKFNSDVGPANPRSAIGYYEPGHYCFVTVDGRQKGSAGLTLKQLASLMHELGCSRAYNLDGGNTAMMVAAGRTVNHPSGGGRPTSDIIAVVEY